MTGTRFPRHPASFRDPSGFVFEQDSILLRQVDPSYREHYDHLMSSGLYQHAVAQGDFIAHEEVETPTAASRGAYKILRPRRLPFISYPYEWCFGQLQAAALATLRLARLGLEHDMLLKDASAFNIQFVGTRPVCIDSLSFALYQEGEPWVAYRQFCRHFLAPLALAAHRDVRLLSLLRLHLDGVPLDLSSRLLPGRTWLRLPLFLHLHLHARAEQRHAGQDRRVRVRPVSRARLRALLDNLQDTVQGLRWHPAGSEWADYYADTNYSQAAGAAKQRCVDAFLDAAEPTSVWDLGANRGAYSRLASRRGIPTVAFDLDPAAVEKNYREGVRLGETHLLPLRQDLMNPSPGLGWHHAERDALLARGPVDAILALALVHHLCLSNNVPFETLARFLAAAGRWLAVEFVPKTDSQVQRLLRHREDVFPHYTEADFEAAFRSHFEIVRRLPLDDSERVIYWMRSRGLKPGRPGMGVAQLADGGAS